MSNPFSLTDPASIQPRIQSMDRIDGTVCTPTYTVSSIPGSYPGASLEQSIDAAALWLATATTVEERRGAWNVLQELVKQRKQDRVEAMEREQGLR